MKEDNITAGVFKGKMDWFFNLSSDEKPLSKMSAGSATIIRRGYKGIVYAAISMIAQDVAKVKFTVTKQGKEVDISKGTLSLLKIPNPMMSFVDLLELTQIYLELVGNAYWWLGRDKLGNVREIWIIPSQNIKPVPKKDDIGIDHYKALGLVSANRFEVDDIVHFRYQNPLNMYEGIGTLQKALLEYDIHNFAKQYVMNFYKNGAIPQGILSTDQKLSEKEAKRIEGVWRDKYQGVESSWEIAVLWGGFKYQNISLNPATEKFIEQGIWTRNDICAIFKIPPSKLGYVEDVNRANAEASNYTYMENCISPKLTKIQETINSSLLPKLSKDQLFFEFEDVVPENIEANLEKEKVNIQKANIGAMTGALTIDEIRELLGFKPVGGESGGKHVQIDIDDEVSRLVKALGYGTDWTR